MLGACAWSCSSDETESNTPTGTAVGTGGQGVGDENGTAITYAYDDPLDRLTEVVAAAGTDASATTTGNTFSDAFLANILTDSSDLDMADDTAEGLHIAIL